MESLSIPPHRRSHSSATKGFSSSASSSSSLKNHYEDVLFSKGGSTKKPLGAQEYTEIFSGSSSIPVLDLSGLEERVGLGDCRNSTIVDYPNIFGGLKNDDVAVPYEKLFNASAKTEKQRISADELSPSQESGSLHYSGRTKRSSGEASDQSIDGVKQQFNLSFNKTSQNNDDASNGKTHIAQFHAVPGFTYFVDGIPQLQKKTEGDRHVHSLKREVSRTWSFSAEVEAFNRGKGGLIWDKLDTPEKLNNVNEFNLKSQPSKVSSLERPSDVTNKADPRISNISGVASREHASGKTDGEYLPLHLDEELDENSVAAVSAAALKKAMEQAQESIRLAKMIMERKRECLRDGTKPISKSSSKVEDKKKTRIDCAAVNCSEGKIYTGDFERSNLIMTGVDGEFAQSASHSDPLIIVGSTEVERAIENDEAAKEHKEEFIGVDMDFTQKETLSFSEKVGLQKQEEKVEARKEATEVPGLVAHVESRDPNLMSRLVENINLMLFRNKRTSYVEMMETGDEKMEQIEKPLHHEKEHEGVAALRNSNKMPETDRSVVDNLDHSEGPENVTEVVARDPHTSLRSHDQVKIVEEECEILRTGQEDQVMEENEHAGDDKEDLNNKFQQNEVTGNQEEMTVLRSEIHNLMNGSWVEQEEIKHNVDERNGNNQTHGGRFDMEENVMSQKEAHKYFKSGEQLKEDMKEDLYKREPEIFPEIEKVEMKDNWAHEPEIDKKSHILDGDRQNIPGDVEQIDERYVNNFSFEGTETIEMEADNRPEVQKTDIMQDEEMNNSNRGEGKGEENQSQHEFQKAVYDKDIDEAVDASSSNVSSMFSENHLNDTSTIFCETQESSDFDLNDRTEEDQKTYICYKENVTMPKVPETFSGLDETTEMPVPHDWCLNDSEENIDGSNLQKTGKGPSSENLKECFGSLNADTEDILPKDHHTSETSGEIHDDGGVCASEPQKQTLPELHFSDNKTAEIDLTYARHVFEQTLGSDEESVSTSSVDSIEGLLVHESQVCTEIPKDETSNKDEIKAGFGMISNERKHGEERSDAVYFELDSERKDTEKSMECERDEVTGENIEKNEENPTGTSSREQKDAKEKVKKFDKGDHQQRIEAIKKGREREKDRIAVERAIREARERAFADARDRAERAAVERAAAEARQRAMAEAREKFDKASMAAKQPVDRASTEAKIRAERAAVERATAEARERALEKARSQKTSAEARTQTDRSTIERFTSSSRNNGLRHSFSSSDLEGVDGTNAESAQRRKARLERHQRITERAANALAEKNMRDLIAQKELAERNRLAESLDADIKRWAMGKEGNLRALLSTLQYILGPNGGWQPISLTEIITAAAVKKAYRKATLYVHPDKLQQRGASIQQKYICEKVFDMLKAAWNRFNSEER